MKPDTVKPGQRIRAEDINRLRDGVLSSRLRAGPGLQSRQGIRGVSISPVNYLDGAVWCLTVATGPNNEPDYTDERYWVRAVVPTNATGDAYEQLSLELQTVLNFEGQEYQPGQGDIMYGFWTTATSLGEYAGHSHSLSVYTPPTQDDPGTPGTLVRVYQVHDSRSAMNQHFVFNSGGMAGGLLRPGQIKDREFGYGPPCTHKYSGVFVDQAGAGLAVWGGYDYWTPANSTTSVNGLQDIMTYAPVVYLPHAIDSIVEVVFVWDVNGSEYVAYAVLKGTSPDFVVPS